MIVASIDYCSSGLGVTVAVRLVLAACGTTCPRSDRGVPSRWWVAVQVLYMTGGVQGPHLPVHHPCTTRGSSHGPPWYHGSMHPWTILDPAWKVHKWPITGR